MIVPVGLEASPQPDPWVVHTPLISGLDQGRAFG